MAGTAVLEREVTREEEVRPEERAAATEHFNKISENYKRIFSDAVTDKADVLVADRPAAPARETHAATEGNDFRNLLADYRPVTADPATHHALFEGLEYKEGELIGDLSAYVETAPAEAAAAAPAVSSEEDAMPTRRTMEMLHPAAMAQSEPQARTSAAAKLSTSAKVALAVVGSALVLAFTLVCVNSGIIRSLNAKTQAKETRITELEQQYNSVQGEIDAIKDPENIAAWAQEHGYTQG